MLEQQDRDDGAASGTITVSRRQQELLVDIIDNWLEGIEESKKASTQDPTITDVETILRVMAAYDVDAADLRDVRQKIVSAHECR